MTEFVFTSPEGKKYRISGPDGATQEEAFQILQNQISGPPSGETTFRGAMSEINKGLGRGLTALPMAVGKELEKSTQDIPDSNILKIKPDENVKAFRERLLSNLKATPASRTEQMLGTGAELGASMAPFMGGAAPIAQKVFGFAAPIAGGVAGEQIAQELGTNPEQGKMLGTFGAPIGMALAGRALSPRLTPELETLVRSGTVPTPGQATGGFLKKFERYPLVQEITSSAQRRAETSFNTSVFNLALKPIGKKADGIGFEGFEKASRLASQAYDDVLPKLNVKYDNQLHLELMKQEQGMLKDTRSYMQDVFQTKVRPHIGKGGVITPADMKKIDSELGKLARDAQRDPAMEKRAITEALQNLQGAIRDTVRRQNPNYAADLDAANAAWNNLVRVGDAVARSGATNGVFSPGQFQTSVRAMDSTLRKGAFKQGTAAMQDVASAGVKVLGNEGAPHVPWGVLRTGLTAGGTGAAIAGTAAASPMIGAPLAAGAATFGSMYTPIGQRAMSSALTGQRPMALRTLGDLMRDAPSYSPAALPIFTQGEN